MSDSGKPRTANDTPAIAPQPGNDKNNEKRPQDPQEIGGPPGPEPTRYGDWEKAGRCIDF